MEPDGQLSMWERFSRVRVSAVLSWRQCPERHGRHACGRPVGHQPPHKSYKPHTAEVVDEWTSPI